MADAGSPVLNPIRRRTALGLLAGAGLTGLDGTARAAGYPERAIELIVPWGPGGGADQLARKVAQLWEPDLGVAVPVINVPGASGVTGLAKMLAGPADGYALSVITGDTVGLQATEGQAWSLDQIRFLGVLIQQSSLFLAAGDGDLQSWADAERIARDRELKVAITGFGTADHVTVEHYRRKGLKLVSVPFAKPGERYAAVVGGNADLLYEQAGDVRSFLDSGQLRPLIQFADERLDFPDVPTSAEQGDDLSRMAYRGIVVRGDTAPEIVARLIDSLRGTVASADYQAYLESQYARPEGIRFGAQADEFAAAEVAVAKRSLAGRA